MPIKDVILPDIGDFENVDVIEVLVKPGDVIKHDDSVITLESEKATMEVPSTLSGTVHELKVKVGDKVSEGDLILTMDVGAEEEQPLPAEAEEAPSRGEAAQAEEAAAPPAPTPVEMLEKPVAPSREEEAPLPAARAPVPPPLETRPPPVSEAAPPRGPAAHASPAVRQFARQLGVDLRQVRGSGPKGRIVKEDVQAHVKEALTRAPEAAGLAGLGIAPMPAVDFARFGPIAVRPLTKIQRVSGSNLHRNWVTIPHVTQFDEADITELEAFRKAEAERLKPQGIRLTPLGFFLKAAVAALREFPTFNASLDPGGEHLILKQYFHIGVAVDTPEGLVVPVIRDVDKKGLVGLARELAETSARARDRKLTPADMQGGCFTISSLGGIGGTYFTPIINAPEVAILGVSRALMRPVYRDGGFEPRLILPFALAFDHRVNDGAAAARFTRYLGDVLSEVRRLLM